MADKDKPDKDTTEANRRLKDSKRRERTEAAAAKISPAVPPAGAAILADVDPALDDRSETEVVLQKDTGGGDRRDRAKRRKNPAVH